MQERRRYVRVPIDDSITLSFDGHQHDVNATLANISLGGAFVYAERLLNEGAEFEFEAVFPPGTLAPKWSRAICRAKVLRTDKRPVAAMFGAALRFLKVQALG